MSKTVGECMTPNPVAIAADASLAEAAELMYQHEIRHLPVIDRYASEGQGAVVGLVSERDLAMISSIPGVDKRRVKVTEAMTAGPYVVTPETPLAEVIATMHERKLGTAVVMRPGSPDEMLGIFSVVDALAVLRLMLRE
jgi:acetoin utilization protein AcuB